MFTYRAKVYNIVDGDTIDVEIDLGFKIYHLCGITEIHKKPRVAPL